jgi:asparaginyl-tRNA synthetase
MTFVSIKEAMKQGTGDVAIRGWVYRVRTSKGLGFILVRDGSSIIQCVVEKDSVSEQVWTDTEKLQIESSLAVTGTIKPDERAPGGYEIKLTGLDVTQFSDKYPIQKDLSEEFLLDVRHLWLRSKKMTAIMKIRATILQSFREHYQEEGHTEYSPPIFHPTQCEGGSTLFGVKYYDTTVYLTQSAQLYSEAMIFALSKVFCIAPTFRAEKSKTSRHLSEFWMAEMEAAWMGIDGLCDDIEKLLSRIVKDVIAKHADDLKSIGRDIEVLQKIVPPFPRITYKEALKILKEKDGMEVPFGKDLRTVEEEKLSRHYDKPLIITRYPKEIMSFYKPRDPKDSEVALCLDVIAPEGYGEIIGGSQRDLDVDEMKKYLEAEGEDVTKYQWYFDSRKYGSVPHSGHGMGVERVVRWICGLENIKDAIPFPRTMKRFSP